MRELWELFDMSTDQRVGSADYTTESQARDAIEWLPDRALGRIDIHQLTKHLDVRRIQ